MKLRTWGSLSPFWGLVGSASASAAGGGCWDCWFFFFFFFLFLATLAPPVSHPSNKGPILHSCHNRGCMSAAFCAGIVGASILQFDIFALKEWPGLFIYPPGYFFLSNNSVGLQTSAGKSALRTFPTI